MKIKIYTMLPPEAKIVREEVFVKEQGFACDDDDIDAVATHFVAFNGYEPVGACRIYNDNEKNTFVLGRLCTRQVCRGKGVGKLLVSETEKYVSEIGGKKMILQAQYRVKDFYSGLGYKEYGDIEYEEGCALIWMKKELQK